MMVTVVTARIEKNLSNGFAASASRSLPPACVAMPKSTPLVAGAGQEHVSPSKTACKGIMYEEYAFIHVYVYTYKHVYMYIDKKICIYNIYIYIYM